jgi:DNA-binding NarL/FixJ family response regulator
MSVRIVIVDDHEVLREGVRSLLAKLRPDWTICGEATDGDEAIQLAQELRPDLVILDITMPRLSGLEAAAHMRKLRFTFPILIFTTHQSERLSADVRESGAQGYVLKSQAARNLVMAIDALLAGGTFFGTPPESKPVAEDDSKSGLSFRISLAFAI